MISIGKFHLEWVLLFEVTVLKSSVLESSNCERIDVLIAFGWESLRCGITVLETKRL